MKCNGSLEALTEGVEPWKHDGLDDALDPRLGEGKGLRPHDRGVDEVEAERVCAVLVRHDRRVGVVLEALRHLLAVLREYKAVANQVLERRLIEQRGGDHHEGVEPPAGLVETLSVILNLNLNSNR